VVAVGGEERGDLPATGDVALPRPCKEDFLSGGGLSSKEDYLPPFACHLQGAEESSSPSLMFAMVMASFTVIESSVLPVFPG